MDITVISNVKNNTIEFKSAQLAKATKTLLKSMDDSKKSFCTAALTLKKIQSDKLFAKDFFDEKGKPSFSAYCEQILGISKTAAYRIMSTGIKLLAPELVNKIETENGKTVFEKPHYFSDFGDTNLALISAFPLVEQ